MHRIVGLGALVGERAAQTDRDAAVLRSRSYTTLTAATPALVLRPYQMECIEALRSAYGTGHRTLILQLATGGGKTVVFVRVVRGACAKGLHVVVLVHRCELIRQA